MGSVRLFCTAVHAWRLLAIVYLMTLTGQSRSHDKQGSSETERSRFQTEIEI